MEGEKEEEEKGKEGKIRMTRRACPSYCICESACRCRRYSISFPKGDCPYYQDNELLLLLSYLWLTFEADLEWEEECAALDPEDVLDADPPPPLTFTVRSDDREIFVET
jgi:hypothetical protein